MSYKLLSVYQLAHHNDCSLIFNSKGVVIRHNPTQKVLSTGPCTNGMYPFQISSQPPFPSSAHVFVTSTVSPTLWHRRLDHRHRHLFNQMINNFGLSASNPSFTSCQDCLASKSPKLPFTLSNSVSKAVLDLVHSDVWGPNSLQSCSGYKFYVTFIDDFSRFCWIFPLHSKSHAFECFIKFHACDERQFSTKLKIL